MTKLCPRGKAAAKRKFAVYPSAYANAYASKICAGKIKDPSGKKRKDFKGPKPAGKAMGGMIRSTYKRGGGVDVKKAKEFRKNKKTPIKTFLKNTMEGKYMDKNRGTAEDTRKMRVKRMGGGLMEATARLKRQGLKSGGIARGCGRVMSNRRKVTKVY
jgi:hypothetical protein